MGFRAIEHQADVPAARYAVEQRGGWTADRPVALEQARPA
jgi:hypothetical protein